MDRKRVQAKREQRQPAGGAEAAENVLPLSPAEKARLEGVSGIVFDVQRYSLHDGPGLRTDVFLKGCPLHCGWCANPESQQRRPELAFFAHNCIECGLFEPSCSVLVSEPDGRQVTAGSSAEIEQRMAVCPTGAIRWIGGQRTAGDVIREALHDLPFYGDSGGITLTGGEPTMQPTFCEALLRLARHHHITTTMETCGHTQWASFQSLLPYLDHVLFDVKHLDPEAHRQFTGMDNVLILDNLRRLLAKRRSVVVRVPLIPGFNAEPQTVMDIAAFVHHIAGDRPRIDLLPYHTLARPKYRALGRDYSWEGYSPPSEGEVAALAEQVRALGFRVSVGGV